MNTTEHPSLALLSAAMPLIAVLAAIAASVALYFFSGICIWLPQYVTRRCVKNAYSVLDTISWATDSWFSVLRTGIWATSVLLFVIPLLHTAVAPEAATTGSHACYSEHVMPLLQRPNGIVSPLIFLTVVDCHITSLHETVLSVVALFDHPDAQWLGASEMAAGAYRSVGKLTPNVACAVAMDRLATSDHPALERAMAHCERNPFTWSQ